MKHSLDKSELFPNDITLGIIGGGQLGKMIGIEAKRMSLNVVYLDPDMNCPASSIADQMIVSDFKVEKSIIKLANKSDVLTLKLSCKFFSSKDLESTGYAHPKLSIKLKIAKTKVPKK
jgi:5-(carboxyamino)imidazole ribonucleotide synthase